MNPFIQLGIRHDIVNAISELGFENPTPIQEQSIPVLLTGSNDFVGYSGGHACGESRRNQPTVFNQLWQHTGATSMF